MKAGDLAALSLGLSGVAMGLAPARSAKGLQLSADSGRGLSEMRAGLGGTFAGLGLWAWLRGTSDAYTAVGVTCLGAASLRGFSWKVDEVEPDVASKALLVGEVALGLAGLAARTRKESS